MLPNIERMILLTGTPSPNGMHDLWSQMYLIDYGERLGRTLTNFRQRFFDKDYFGHKYTLREGSAQKIEGQISDRDMHMSADDYLRCLTALRSPSQLSCRRRHSQDIKSLREPHWLNWMTVRRSRRSARLFWQGS